MDIFNSKKIGEVLAFIRIGQELCERGRVGLTEAYGSDVYDAFCNELDQWLTDIEERCDDTSFAKAKVTTEKLRQMMESYVKDNWDDPTEMMEWLGFYLGAAIIHWTILKGIAKELQDENLQELADEAHQSLHDLFHMTQDSVEGLALRETE